MIAFTAPILLSLLSLNAAYETKTLRSLRRFPGGVLERNEELAVFKENVKELVQDGSLSTTSAQNILEEREDGDGTVNQSVNQEAEMLLNRRGGQHELEPKENEAERAAEWEEESFDSVQMNNPLSFSQEAEVKEKEIEMHVVQALLENEEMKDDSNNKWHDTHF